MFNLSEKQIAMIFKDAEEIKDIDLFVSDWALSDIWGDSPEDEMPEDRLEWLREIWVASHRSVKEIASAAGISNRRLAERFTIEYRTMEYWSAGPRKCPLYIRLMMQECLGLLHR